MATKKVKVGNVPNLRFPGFEGEWEDKKLGEITSWSSGGTPPKDNPSFWNGDIPWISASSMRGLAYSDSELKITQAGLKEGSKLASKGTLLILVRGSMLFNKIPIGIASKDVAFNQDVKSITVSDYSTSDYILNWVMAFESKILNMVTGTGIGAGKLDLSDLKALEINIPSLPEQRKIALFLSLLNEQIRTQSKIIQQLETLMQILREKLFTRNYRFKDIKGKDFKNWEEKGLHEIGNTYNGLIGKNKDDFGKGKRYIQYKQIFDSPKVQLEACSLVEVTDNENQNIVEYGDIFFTISSETPGEIGMASVLLDDVEDDIYLNSFCFGFRSNSRNTLKPEYAQHFFRSKIFRNEIVKLAQGSTRYNMSKVEFLKISIRLPSYEEQALISERLSLIDQKISIEEKILRRFEKQKQYMLKNLFI